MIFTTDILTPKNTSVDSPQKTPWKLVNGLIYRVEVQFPPGPSGLVGVALHTSNIRLYPYGANDFFKGDNTTIGFDDLAYFDISTSQIEVWTYNEDTRYDHTVQIRIGIVDDPTFIKAKLGITDLNQITQPLSELIALITAQQAVQSNYKTVNFEDTEL